MIKVLFIDDDIKLCKAIERFTRGEFDLQYLTAPSFGEYQSLKEYILDEQFNVIVFDLEIGNTNGLELFNALLPLPGVSTIFLSGASDVNHRVQALRDGADDFLRKPIDLLELQIKIEKIVENKQAVIYEYIDDYKIDNQTEQIYLSGRLLNLPPMAERLLKYMLKNQERDLSREELVSNIWCYLDEGGSRTIDTTINKIRSETRDANILTVRGVGYRYEKIR